MEVVKMFEGLRKYLSNNAEINNSSSNNGSDGDNGFVMDAKQTTVNLDVGNNDSESGNGFVMDAKQTAVNLDVGNNDSESGNGFIMDAKQIDIKLGGISFNIDLEKLPNDVKQKLSKSPPININQKFPDELLDDIKQRLPKNMRNIL